MNHIRTSGKRQPHPSGQLRKPLAACPLAVDAHAHPGRPGRRHGNDKVAVVGDRALWGGEDEGGALAVFVDDDIAELSSDALVDLSSEGRLLRVLFRR